MNKIEYDFGYGEKAQYDVFDILDISNAEKRPGLYAWYLRCQFDTEGFNSMKKIHSLRALKISATAQLGESYIGKVHKQYKDAETVTDEELLRIASVAFSTPIYVGISKNVRNRLKQHYNELTKHFPTSRISTSVPDETIISPDTEEESSTFAQRIGSALKNAGYKSTTSLYVKVIYANNINKFDLRKTESAINQLLHPVMGRR